MLVVKTAHQTGAERSGVDRKSLVMRTRFGRKDIFISFRPKNIFLTIHSWLRKIFINSETPHYWGIFISINQSSLQ